MLVSGRVTSKKHTSGNKEQTIKLQHKNHDTLFSHLEVSEHYNLGL